MRLPLASVIAIVMVWAAPARAAWDVDWVRSVGTGGAFFNVETTDQTLGAAQDVESRQQIGNSLAFDNAYLHMGVSYDVTLVQFQDNPDQGYLDHRMGMNLNVDRWLRHYTQDGRLTITARARVSPGLPPLDASRLSTGISDRPPEPGEELTPTESFVRHDVLSASDTPTGYTLLYGMSYSDDIDPFRRYDVGWNIEDNRYDSELLQDWRTLSLEGTYAVRLSRGEMGVVGNHVGPVGASVLDDSFGLAVFRAAEARKVTWRVEPGVQYQREQRDLRGSFRVEWAYTMPRTTVETAYAALTGISSIAGTQLERVHTVFLRLFANHNYRTPRWITVGGRLEESSRRVEVSVGQQFRILRTLELSFRYARSALWWDDVDTGTVKSWKSDLIGGDLQWQF